MHIPGLCCFGDAALMISILGQGMAIDNMQPTKPLTDTIGNACTAQGYTSSPAAQRSCSMSPLEFDVRFTGLVLALW